MQVVELEEKGEPAWDDYVDHSTHAVPHHLSGWRRVMQRTYGYTTHYLMAIDGGRVEGVLPLFEIPSWLTGRSIGSLPGGVCAENARAAEALIRRAKDIAARRGVGRVLLRDARECWDGAASAAHRHSAFVIELADTVDASWKRVDRRLRQHVRAAEKNGLRVEIARNADNLAPFYRTFSLFTRQVGTPVFSRDFLRHIIETFPDRFSVACLYKESAVVGAFFQLELADTMYGVWGASLPAHRDLYPTHLGYWTLMRYSLERGFRRFDMGRSPLDSGAHEFKRHWGGRIQPIYQITCPANGRARAAVAHVDPLEPGRAMQMFTRVWRKTPLAITQVVGPRLRWHVPFA